jgi:multidrug efflux system membrane fusion protein
MRSLNFSGHSDAARVEIAGYRCASTAFLATVLFALTTLTSFAQESKGGKGAREAIGVPVSIATVSTRDIPVRLQAIGNVEPFSTVALKARVDGQIVEVNFREGQEVRKGSILFKIDPRPFEAALRQAEANFLKDSAQRDQARSQERRYQELLQKNFVSKDAYAQFRTNAETAEAVSQASRAAVDNAKLNLEYCTIRSPIDGYTGKIQIQMGNLVKANDVTPLVVLNQVHPIYVSFSVPEQQLSGIRSYMSRGPVMTEASTTSSTKPASGNIVFVDNAVDQTTGTIKLRASFANKDNALWPGQFANVNIKLYEQKNAIVVPSQAIQNGPNGQFVFVIKADMTTEVRKVSVARSDGETAVVASGLQSGEQVVTRGQLRLAPGVKVSPTKS